MGQHVDRLRVGAGWMVADAEGHVLKLRPGVGDDKPKNHPEATSRGREIDLEALAKPCAVLVVRVTGPQLGARNPVFLVSALGCLGRLSASRCRPLHVLPEGVGIEAGCETQLAGQRLPLAVGGKHVRAMLDQEALPLLFGGLASTGALLDGFPRGIGNERERPVRALIGDDVLAIPVTA